MSVDHPRLLEGYASLTRIFLRLYMQYSTTVLHRAQPFVSTNVSSEVIQPVNIKSFVDPKISESLIDLDHSMVSTVSSPLATNDFVRS